MGGLKALAQHTYLTAPKTVRRVGVGGEWVTTEHPDLFTIAGGDIIASIWGKITVAFSAQATLLQLRNDTVVLGLACTTLTGQAVDIILTPTGIAGDAMIIGSAGVEALHKIKLTPGIIDCLVDVTNIDGAIDWYIRYEQVIPGHGIVTVL